MRESELLSLSDSLQMTVLYTRMAAAPPLPTLHSMSCETGHVYTASAFYPVVVRASSWSDTDTSVVGRKSPQARKPSWASGRESSPFLRLSIYTFIRKRTRLHSAKVLYHNAERTSGPARIINQVTGKLKLL